MIKFGTGKLGFARDTNPPSIWNGSSLDDQYSLVIAWYGNEGVADNTNRFLLRVLRDGAVPNDTSIAVSFRGPSQSSSTSLAITARRASGNIRTFTQTSGNGSTFRCASDKHYCLVINFDAGNSNSADDTMTAFLLEEGSSTAVVTGEGDFSFNNGCEALSNASRIVVGIDAALSGTTRDAFYGPYTACFMRRGLISQTTAEGYWATSGGPRIKDFIGEPEDIVFIYGQGSTAEGENTTTTPVSDTTAACSAWFDGDTETYAEWLQSTPSTLHDSVIYNPQSVSTATPTPAHMYETGKDWSGFWQKSPPETTLGLGSVAGRCPKLRAVLSGNVVSDAPARIAACTGSSRWANNTPTPQAIGSSETCYRNHGMGLKLSRPDYDGGMFIPDCSEWSQYDEINTYSGNTGFNLGDSDVRDSDWTRFSFHGSSTSLPGNGRPGILSSTGDATVRYTVTHSSEDTRQGVLLLNYPGGGTVDVRLNVAASGTGAGTTTTPSPVSGSASVDTDTEVGTCTFTSTTSTTTVVDDTTGIEPGHVLYSPDAGNVGGINIVESVDSGTSLTTRWSWADAPSASDTISFGPASYTFVELPYAGNASFPDRGVRLVHGSGGDVVVIATGYRESAHGERICYIPMGRGGIGYTDQAARMATETTFEDILAAMGAEMVFAGIASQQTPTVDTTIMPNAAASYEIYGTPDTVHAGGSLGEFTYTTQHEALRNMATSRPKAMYLQIHDEFGSLIDQGIARQRLEGSHHNGRGSLDSGDAWWTALEAQPSLASKPSGSAPQYIVAALRRRSEERRVGPG